MEIARRRSVTRLPHAAAFAEQGRVFKFRPWTVNYRCAWSVEAMVGGGRSDCRFALTVGKSKQSHGRHNN